MEFLDTPNNVLELSCLCLRMTPVVICIGAHLSTLVLVPPGSPRGGTRGLWWEAPTDDYCVRRACEYGFSIPNLKRQMFIPSAEPTVWALLREAMRFALERARAVLTEDGAFSATTSPFSSTRRVSPLHWRYSLLVTHLLVHLSNQHAVANALCLSCTLAEFGSCSDEDEDEMLEEAPENVGGVMGTVMAACACSRRAIQAHLHDRNWRRSAGQALQAVAVMEVSSVLGGIGVQFGLQHLWRAMQRHDSSESGGWVRRAIGSEQHFVACGASAAVFGLSGFNLAAHGRLLTSLGMMPAQILAVAGAVVTSVSNTAGENVSDAGEATQIGYAAHVGGYVVGFVIGSVVRVYRRRRQLRRQETQPNH